MPLTCKQFLTAPALAMLMALASAPPSYAEEASYALTIADGKFQPESLEVKAGKGFKLTITNAQKRPAEFESHQLKREKVIPPGATAIVNVGPLQPGTYKFFDDFNPSTKGEIVAK